MCGMWDVAYGWCGRALDGLHLAHEIRLEAAGGIVPLETFAIAVPQFQAVLFLPVLVAEIIGFPSIPVGKCDGTPGGHPKVVALIGQISAGYPEMLVAQACEGEREREGDEKRFAVHAYLGGGRCSQSVSRCPRTFNFFSLAKPNAARDSQWPSGHTPLLPLSAYPFVGQQFRVTNFRVLCTLESQQTAAVVALHLPFPFHLPKSRMCFSSLSFSSCDEMLARCMPW